MRESSMDMEVEHGGPPGLAPTLDNEAGAQLREKFEELARLMPGHGWIALKYMLPEAKEKAREIAGWLLRQPGFVGQAGRYQEISREQKKSSFLASVTILKTLCFVQATTAEG